MVEELNVNVDPASDKEKPNTKAGLEAQIRELKHIVESYAKREKLTQEQMNAMRKSYEFKIQYMRDCVQHCLTSINLALTKEN